MYKVFLLLLPFGVAAGVLAENYIPVFMNTSMPCAFYGLTGLYCPGCGGTRAVLSLLHGQFFKAFFYHPVVVYTGVLFLWYYISNTVEFVSGGRIGIGRNLKVRDLWIVLGIILLQWLIKNVLLLVGIAYPVRL